MKRFRALMLFLLAFLLFPIHARSQNLNEESDSPFKKIRNSLSINWAYLPVRFPKYDATTNGQGFGVDYRFVYAPDRHVVYKLGIGLTYSRIDESGNSNVRVSDSYIVISDNNTVTVNADYQTRRSYCYLSVPAIFGFRFVVNRSIYMTPFVGLSFKYNISYVEKRTVESMTYNDRYFELFDENVIDKDKTNPQRCILQAESGFEVEYRKMFMTMSYSRDFERMFSEAMFKSRNIGVNGPYTFSCWKVGVGVYF